MKNIIIKIAVLLVATFNIALLSADELNMPISTTNNQAIEHFQGSAQYQLMDNYVIEKKVGAPNTVDCNNPVCITIIETGDIYLGRIMKGIPKYFTAGSYPYVLFEIRVTCSNYYNKKIRIYKLHEAVINRFTLSTEWKMGPTPACNKNFGNSAQNLNSDHKYYVVVRVKNVSTNYYNYGRFVAYPEIAVNFD